MKQVTGDGYTARVMDTSERSPLPGKRRYKPLHGLLREVGTGNWLEVSVPKGPDQVKSIRSIRAALFQWSRWNRIPIHTCLESGRLYVQKVG